ncbi:hypothetical protein TWF132_008148 [Orbilia oligospora]|nr:hypothetical protein TWF751_004979 [Orbilia oligospora]KAF3287898.1 hypothetical protein TWF132_008148 [Orbilia oligospora]
MSRRTSNVANSHKLSTKVDEIHANQRSAFPYSVPVVHHPLQMQATQTLPYLPEDRGRKFDRAFIELARVSHPLIHKKKKKAHRRSEHFNMLFDRKFCMCNNNVHRWGHGQSTRWYICCNSAPQLSSDEGLQPQSL